MTTERIEFLNESGEKLIVSVVVPADIVIFIVEFDVVRYSYNDSESFRFRFATVVNSSSSQSSSIENSVANNDDLYWIETNWDNNIDRQQCRTVRGFERLSKLAILDLQEFGCLSPQLLIDSLCRITSTITELYLHPNSIPITLLSAKQGVELANAFRGLQRAKNDCSSQTVTNAIQSDTNSSIEFEDLVNKKFNFLHDENADDLDNEDNISEIKNIILQQQQQQQQNNNDDDSYDDIFVKLDCQQWFDKTKADRLWQSREQLLKTCFDLRNKWISNQDIGDSTQLLNSSCLKLLEAAKLDGYKIGSRSLVELFPLSVAINLSLPPATSPEKLMEWHQIVGSSLVNVVAEVFPSCSDSNRFALRYQIDTLCRLFQFAQLKQPFVHSDSTRNKSTMTVEWALQLHIIEVKQEQQLLDCNVDFFRPFLQKWQIDYWARIDNIVLSSPNLSPIEQQQQQQQQYTASSSSFISLPSVFRQQQSATEYRLLLDERDQLLRDIKSIHNHNQRLLLLVKQQQQIIEQLKQKHH